MIVYRPQERAVETAAVIAGVTRAAAGVWSHDCLVDLLIRFGEFESAVADACGPVPCLRETAVSIGRRFAAMMYRPVPMPAFETLALPKSLTLSTPEGYAFYSLYPEAYAASARAFARECEPREACVIGIRSIGASLSAVVAGALEEAGVPTRAHTVRPEGHPFDRRVTIPRELAREWSETGSWFAVVDEGPGLSGSSFASVLKALAELGVPDERVALFPGWEGDPARFINDDARRLWPRYRKYPAGFDPAWIGGDRTYRDFSAGLWRECLIRDRGAWPAVQPWHEARKLLAGDLLYKFSGLGEYGEAKYQRAAALADAGFAPEPERLENGFIGFRFEAAVPRTSGDGAPDVASYLGFRARCFPAPRSVGFEQMLEMIEANAGVPALRFEPLRGEFEGRPACAVDGRMLANEFIESDRGWRKADSVDHCADHFFPGCADIAWDLAGTSIEFAMHPHERDRLLARYRSETGDEVDPDLMSFYETAYAAFRYGYVAMAAESTAGTEEQPRFEALKRKYQARLRSTSE